MEITLFKPVSEHFQHRIIIHVHSTWFLFFGHEGFQVIADDDGQILTDMELLAHLRNVRSQIMKTENKPAYTIIGNKGLVSLATYRPENREEFIALYEPILQKQ